jgi:hypothetical protein
VLLGLGLCALLPLLALSTMVLAVVEIALAHARMGAPEAA